VTKSKDATLVMAIALGIASKRLQRHTGIHAADWRRSLLEEAVSKFNSLSPTQLQSYIAKNFEWND